MRYWKTSILWICLTPWHLACFGGGGWKCEHAWGSVASNNSIKELPSPFPEQFSVHICCPLRKGGFQGHRCSTLCRRGLGRRTEMWSCQDHLPATGGEWAAVSRCTWPSSLSAGKPLQEASVLFFHRYLWGVLMQQGWVQDSWGRERFWGFAWNVLEELRRVFESS